VSTTVTVSPPNGSAGTYHASITATSQATSVSEAFDIIVTGSTGGSNRPPVLSAPASDTVAIGSTLTFDVTATDPDGDHVDLSGTALPPGSGFVDHANDTGTFTWTPVVGQEGTYTASFTGTDGQGGSGSAATSITVTGPAPSNHPPTLSAPATEQVNVGASLSFTVTATDPDGDHVALSASALPSGATFTDHGDNTGSFAWTPGSNQAGNYNVSFLGYDGRGGTGTANTSIAVMQEIASESIRMFTEKVHIALHKGASSRMISRKSPPIGAAPITRITSPGLHVRSVSYASTMECHHEIWRMSMSCAIAEGILDAASRRR